MKPFLRTLTLLIVFLLAANLGYLSAQSIDASEIIKMINAGQNVSLDNTTVRGNLDFTKLDNMREVGSDNKRKEYRSEVRVLLRFTECTFTGKVQAYISSEGNWNDVKSEPLYNADFNENVSFEGCTFEEDALFKYSEFEGPVSFENCEFKDNALFKYTKFEKPADFSGVRFRNADFKYTEFSDGVTFANARFRDDAVFKYTELHRNVSFAGAIFEAEANFKYIKFPSGTNLTNTSFGRYTDFKYATLGGKKFSR